MKNDGRLIVVEQNIKFIKEEMIEIKNTLNKFIDSADKRYASKTTEQIVYGLCGIILAGVFTGLLTKLLGLW